MKLAYLENLKNKKSSKNNIIHTQTKRILVQVQNKRNQTKENTHTITNLILSFKINRNLS